MEDGHGKDSKASSDEASSADPPPLDLEDAASRRPYYECTFCKRGFSNAQALGGHMNIHRKDRARARPRPPALPAGSHFAVELEEYCGAFYPQVYEPPARSSASYGPVLFPASGSGASERRRTTDDDGGGLQLRLGLSSGHDHVDGGVVEGREGWRRKEVDEGEVDLELRLGHHP
ncbi:hypothetical protein Cni_G19444 [Canna indica]|uniref:C2H2-type domain-containing protein n=1 Tax=Canna indica TaxID=4628 RepID=A0AAQ3KMC2_9LILI|nr:hypothetical protein Cni_G19444 [Canna indica]